MTLSDFIFGVYDLLLDAGWRMQEIDGMDMLGYLTIRCWKLNKKEKPKPATIDSVWPGLRP